MVRLLARAAIAALSFLSLLQAQQILAAEPVGAGYVLLARSDHSIVLTTMDNVSLRSDGSIALQDSKPTPTVLVLRSSYVDKSGVTREVVIPCTGYKTDKDCFNAYVLMCAWMEAQFPPRPISFAPSIVSLYSVAA